jgi:hypothetical protein
MDKIQFSKSFEDFILQTKDESKVSKYLHHYLWGNKIVAKHVKADRINYLTFRKNGTISYLPIGRELKVNDDGTWSRDGRQEGKPAKTITQILSDAMLRAVTNRDLEIFSNLYKGQASDLYTIKEAKGDEIKEIYQLQIPFTSCMNGGENTSKLGLYTNNPDRISLLYVKAGNQCVARALMWIDNQGNKIIDRVYGSEEFRTMFRDYAKEIGAWKKVYDGAGESNWFNPEGDTVDRKYFYIKVDSDFESYPYVDTMCYLNDNVSPSTLSNNDQDATKKLQCTSGGYEDLDGIECFDRSGRYNEDDCRWSEYHDAWIYEDDAVYIEDISDYFYYDNGRRRDAIRIGRRDYILVDDCEEVEVFDPSSLDEGLMEIDDVCTFTCYKLPCGDLLPSDDADIVEVFVIDGEIMGQID